MADRPSSGELLGIPYNFEKPSVRRMLSSYWQPGEGMLVRKPFGIGYTLNLASWRSWIVLAVAGALVWHESNSGDGDGDGGATTTDRGPDGEPVEVVVDD